MSALLRFATPVVTAGVIALTLAACSTPTESTAASASTAAAAAGLQTSTVKASDVVAAFEAAGLPAANSRDNTANQCGPDGAYKCSEWVTTDNLSVGKFTSAEQFRQMEQYGAYMQGDIVLSYNAARTPEADRPKYEAALDELMADAQ